MNKVFILASTFISCTLGNSLAGDWQTPSDHYECSAMTPRAADAAYIQTPSAAQFSAEAADPLLPWIAKLEVIEEELSDGRLRVQNCVGVAVAPEWILTAGHCVGDRNWLRVEATLGAIDLNDERALRRTAFEARCKPGIDLTTLAEDLALLRLSDPLPSAFPFAALPARNEATPIAPLAVSGGWRRFDSESRTDLLQRSYAAFHSEQADGSLVLSPLSGELQPICVGESGAPLLSEAEDKPIALLSAILTQLAPSGRFDGSQCREGSYKLVFEPLAPHSDWLARMIAPEAPWPPEGYALATLPEAEDAETPAMESDAETARPALIEASDTAPIYDAPLGIVEVVTPSFQLEDGPVISTVMPVYDAPEPQSAPIWDGGVQRSGTD